MKVLLVDDETAILEQAKIFLQKEVDGLEVETVTSAEKALDLLEENGFDAVVSDYQMPEMDGLEFLEVVRNDRDSDIPFIIFTGKGREEVAIKALNLGADRYLQKGGSPKSQYGVLADAILQEIHHYVSEKDLQESEERYRRLFETAQDGMIILDAGSGEIKDANPYIQDLTGYSKEELVGKELWQIGTFEDVVESKKRFDELVEEGFIRYKDLPIKTKKGEERTVEFVSNTYEAGGEKVVQCNIRDVSERKKREEELQRERKRFRKIFNNANDAIYLHKLTEEGMPGEFIEVNDVACEMLGYSREELLKMSPQDIDSSKEADELPEVMEELLEEGDARFEMHHQAKDGTEIPVEIYSHLFELEGEERVLSVARDITERKKAEEKLKKERDRAQRYLETAEVIMVSLNPQGEVIQANRKASEVLGYDKEDIIGKNWFEKFVPEEYRDEIRDVHKGVGESEYPEYYESPVLTKSGEIRTILWHNSILKEEEGNVNATLSSGIDITERKELEEKARRNRERLERSQEIAKVGSWEIDLENGDLSWSDETYRIFEVPIGKSISYDEFLEFIHPEDRDYVDEKWNEALETGKYDIEHRILVDGETKWVREKADIRFDDEGEPIEAIGSVQDITDRKEAEQTLEDMEKRNETLRKGMEKYRQLTETVPDPILFIDKNSGEIMDANKQAENLFGMDRGKIIGKELSEIRPEEEADRYRKMFEGKGIGEMEELHILNGDGDKVPVEVRTSNLELQGRETVLGVFRNISERKKAEEREDFLHSLLRHDVRNKLQIIQGYNELLEDFDLPEEAERYITKGKKGMKEAAEIIEKVRHLREAQEEEILEVRIDTAINEAIDQAKPTAEEKEIEIEADCPGKGCKVLGGSLLDRVFSNIIENAIQHSGGNKIQIHGERGEEEIVCIIEDDGKGIPDEDKDKIFEKGYTTDKERGTGLGLFLVKTLLDIYEGSIEVKDSDLGGTRFDVRLKKA